MKPVSLLYLTFNRLEFTKKSLPALIESVNWSLVERFCLWDDSSNDGTWEYLNSLYLPKQTDLRQISINTISLIMNKFIFSCNTPFIAKIDNDIVVEAGWMEACLSVLQAEQSLGFLGMEINREGNMVKAGDFGYAPSNHIGGVGIFRRRVFQSKIIPMIGHSKFDDRFFGFTRYQQRECKAWLKGFIQPCFVNEDLDYFHVLRRNSNADTKYKELAEQYTKKHWQRRQR